jgi:hypothetical protein
MAEIAAYYKPSAIFGSLLKRGIDFRQSMGQTWALRNISGETQVRRHSNIEGASLSIAQPAPSTQTTQ